MAPSQSQEISFPTTMTHQLALHIFRRDLRLHDNSALIYALQKAQQVIPVFIVDPRQVKDNPYKSQHALTFMIHSLDDLAEQLARQGSRLYLFYGIAEEVLATLLQKHPIDLVTFNKDYTPFARQRDHAIKTLCQNAGVSCHMLPDTLLHEPEVVHKQDGSPYVVFTPFFNKAVTLPIRLPSTNTATNYYQAKIDNAQEKSFLHTMLPPHNPHIALHGGSQEGQQLLQRVQELLQGVISPDIPSNNHTSLLAAHHKFGTISIRQTYHTLRKIPTQNAYNLIRQLYWRDFFTHIAYHFPHVWEGPFYTKYAHIPWQNNPELFKKWCDGATGFPIVDAGMQQLNTTGHMHNRLRMITASFLVKHLHIDWRWGERYFAQHLIDYDPAVNNGNWQWVASTGCDAQPYFRIFNPWRQQCRFDPQALYIKRWLPQLRPFSPKQLHKLFRLPLLTNRYPSPIVDHATSIQHTKKIYQIHAKQKKLTS